MNENQKEERLLKIFANVNDWVKFAEAKNLMLIAFNGVSIFGVLKLFDFNFPKELNWIKWYLAIAMLMLVFSFIISLLSSVPRLKMLKGGEFASPSNNIWYFETLKCKDAVDIIQEVYGTDDKDFSKYEIDLAEQIIVNSNIASKKYSYFTIAVWITIAAYITIVLAGIFFIYLYINNNYEKV